MLFTAAGQEKMIGGFMNVSFIDWETSAIFKDPDGNQFVLSTG